MSLAVIVMLVGAPVLLLSPPAQAAKAGTCTIVGTAGDDVLLGTAGDDVICGLGGDDKILGLGGDDVLRGGGGDDVVRGGPGDDRVAGGRGDDRVFGQAGDDVVRGDGGDDEVIGGPGNDRLGGFRGADQLDGADAARFVDVLRCGPGPDTAAGDPADVVKPDCETVVQNDPPTDVTLVPSSISENELPGSDIGRLTAVDADAGDSHTFALVPGAGSADNALVRVDGDSLESVVRYDFETDSSFSVRVRATDDAGEFTEKALTVTVTDANDAPVAVDDDAAGTEDTTLDLPVSGAGSPVVNDTDQDGDPLTVSAVSNPSGGTVSISGGEIHFVPTTNLCGSNAATFDYTVSDGHGNGGTDTGTVTIDLICVDDLPNAVDDDKTVAEDASATALTVLANDTDPENDPISVTTVSDPDHGTTSFTAADVTYTPDADYCNSPPPYDTFTYGITDGDTATVRVTVTCVNDAPTAVDDDRATDEDTPLSDPVTGAGSPAANDTDVDSGDTLTVTAVSNPTGGTVGIASGQVTFTPTANLCGANAGSYDYTVGDGNGGTDTGTVTIDLTCVNDPPVANDDSRTVAEDSGPTTFVTLRGNDTDVESDPITITGASDPAHGATTFTAADVTYTPDADFCGPDSFTYTVNGGDTATVSVTVTCVNDPPVADDDSATVTEDDPATAVDVLGNDDDVEGDGITISAASDPANGTVVLTGGTAGAHTGLTYQPDPDYCNDPGAPGDDTFTYTVNGGDTATVSVVVTCVDDDPTADDDTATVTLNDPATVIDVLANDNNADGGPMAIATATDPANGTVVLTGGTPGNHTGLTYEPDPAYCNTEGTDPDDTFTYTLTPGGDSATVSVEVFCDVPPVGVDDLATVDEDSAPTAVDVLTNDTNPDGGPKVIVSATDPLEGTVVLTGPVGARDGLTYEPDPNYCNEPGEATEDTFDYTLNGGDTATVSVIVTCIDDAPVANDDTATVAEDSGATAVDVLANDEDVEVDAITITSTSDPANGTVVLTGPVGAHDGLTYAPDANYCNDPPPFETFTYTVNGGDTATVSVTVTCVPDAPTLDNSAGTTTYTEDTAAVVVDGSVTISNPDGLAMTAGSVTLTDDVAGDVLDWIDNDLGDSIVEGTSTALVVDLTGTGTAAEWEAALEAVTFATPSQNPSGADRIATFSVTTSAGSPTDTKLVDAANVDDLPIAVDDSATVLEDAGASAVTVLTNDTDVDAGPMTITAVSNPDNGTAVITGGGTGLTYAPDPNYCNDPPGTTPDTFTYTLNGGGAPQTATVSMTVTCVNDAPVANDETFNGASAGIGNTALVVDDPTDGAPADPAGPQKSITGDILANDTDIDSPSLSVVPGTTSTGGGTVTMEADGDFTVFPPVGCAASYSFDYTVTDGDLTDTGTVDVALSECVWYVDASVPTTGDGRSHSPLKDLSTLNGAGGSGDVDGADDYLFLNGGGSFTAGLELEGGQRLFGQPHGLTVDGTALLAAGSTNPTISTAAGNGLTLAADNTVQGIDLGSAPAGFAALAGSSVGTATMNTVTAGVINNSSGGAVNISGGTLAMAFTNVSSNNATNDGIRLDNTAGTFTASGGSLQNAGGQDVDISGNSSGDSVDFTYGGTITDDQGALVNVSGQSGGTKDFNGAITDGNDGDGSGISLTSNGGATVRFDGGLTMSTGTNPAFTATGGGTVVVTGAANTLTTGAATALNVANTNIGSDDLTFRSISSTGAANGIVLNTTGASGGLTVTGNGGSCTSAGSCTGGAIQASTGDGISLTGVQGGTSLTRVFVGSGGDDGIDALTVVGLTVDASTIVNNGNAANEEGISLAGATGAIAITGTSVTGSAFNNLRLENSSGTISSLTLSSSKFNNNSQATGNHGALVDIGGTATLTTATLTGNEFRDNYSIGLQVAANSSANINGLTISGNTFTGTSTGPTSGTQEIAIDVSKAGTSNLTFAISNNTGIVGHNSHGINVFSAAGVGTGGQLRGRVENNTIGNPAVSSSGSQIGNCLRVNLNGDSADTILVNGNTLRQCSLGRGIEVIGRNGTGQKDVTVTNNDVNPNDTTGFPLAAIFVQSNCVTVCATVRTDIRNNTVPVGTAFDLGSGFLQLIETAASNLQLVDSAPASADCAAQLASTNTGSTSASAGCALIAGPIGTPP